MKEFIKKTISFVSSANSLIAFSALLTGYFTAHFGLLTHLVSIPVWLLLIAAFLPFATWLGLRHCLQIKKREYKTGDLVSILGDKRPFIVYEYYTWQPLHLKLKEQNGNYTICVHQKFIVAYKEMPDLELSLSRTLDAITQRPHPKYTATIVKL